MYSPLTGYLATEEFEEDLKTEITIHSDIKIMHQFR